MWNFFPRDRGLFTYAPCIIFFIPAMTWFHGGKFLEALFLIFLCHWIELALEINADLLYSIDSKFYSLQVWVPVYTSNLVSDFVFGAECTYISCGWPQNYFLWSVVFIMILLNHDSRIFHDFWCFLDFIGLVWSRISHWPDHSHCYFDNGFVSRETFTLFHKQYNLALVDIATYDDLAHLSAHDTEHDVGIFPSQVQCGLRFSLSLTVRALLAHL